MFDEDVGLCTVMQNHLLLDIVISVQIISLRFVSRSFNLLAMITFLTNSINPHALLYPSLLYTSKSN